MKPAALDYVRATSLAEAAALLVEGGEGARILAGGQSLGPMLNFRLVRPRLLIDVMHIPEVHGVHETEDDVVLGAAVTHAAVEDGAAPDIGKGVLVAVAAGIAYRAVRNRGTVCGSLCHADPAADWVTALAALGASVVTYRAGGGRAIPVAAFVQGAFSNLLEMGELVAAVRIPKLSRAARWGWYKACRKPGEFASAIGAVVIDPEREIRRAAIGATGGRPMVLCGDAALPDAADRALAESGPPDRFERQIQRVALRRAFAAALS